MVDNTAKQPSEQTGPRPSDVAIAFLQAFDATGRHNLVAIHPGGAVEGHTFELQDWGAVAKWVDTRHLTHNLYFSQNEPRAGAPHSKLSKSDIAAIRSISVDIDPDGVGEFEAQRLAIQQRLRKAVKEEGLPQPTIVVDSGNGLQAHWLLEEKASADTMKGWAEAQARAFSRRLGGDATHNIDRLLRLPGTRNIPNAKKQSLGRVERPTQVIAQIPARYKVLALSNAVPPVQRADTRASLVDDALVPRFAEVEAEIAGYDDAPTFDQLDEDLRARFNAALMQSSALADLWSGTPPDDNTGSGFRWALAGRLARIGGFSAADFAALAWVWPHAHGNQPVTARALARDWVRNGEKIQRDVERHFEADEGDAHAAGQPAERPAASSPAARSTGLLRPTPYSFPDPRTIPPRQWIYPPHLIRKYLSSTVAPGGVGKSSLLITEMLAMASGKPLLGVQPKGQFRCWLFNAEDPRQEIDMRIAAAIQHHGLTREDLEGRLFTDSGRDTPLVIAKSGRDGATILQPVTDNLVAVMRERGIDVLQVDPFVSTHRVTESNNDDMDLVAKEWSRIADLSDAAVDLVHHTRKTGGAEVTVEDSRGATALINAARSARVLVRMSAAEAVKLGVANPKRYLRIGGDPKNNLAPPISNDETVWFEMVSVHLMNGGGDGAEAFMSGDSVGVVSLADLGNRTEVEPSDQLVEALAAIAAGAWRADVRSGNWVGRAIASAYGLDADEKADRAKINAILTSLRRTGKVHEVQRLDESRHQRLFVEVQEAASDGGSVFD